MNIVIWPNEADQRFDRFLRKYYKPHVEIKLGDIFSWIRKGAIKVNGRKAKEEYRLKEKDIITWDEKITTEKSAANMTVSKKQKVASHSLEKIKALLIYEDDNRLVWNKPAGVVVHPGDKHTGDISLHDMMLSYLQQTGQRVGSVTFKPAFCFRIDKDTSGLIISAKTYEALQWLNEQIRDRKVTKFYRAIVEWIFPKEKTMDAPLFKWYDSKSWKGKTFINDEKGVEAKTVAKLIQSVQHKDLWPISLLNVQIHTWRMHQIRIHTADAGYPVVGDLTYGNAPLNRIATKKCWITRQLLHSYTYWFFDTFANKEVSWTAPLPDDFTALFPNAK